MDFINFKVGPKTIALKILDILLTERYEHNLTELPNDNLSFIGVKDYMGKPTPIFDLGIVLNKKSTQETNNELAELLIQREKEHVDWINALEHSITTGEPFEKEKDANKSKFGQWYNSFSTDNEDLASILKRFEQPLKALHSIAHELLELVNQGEHQKAITQFQEHKRKTFTLLIRLFESAREQVVLDYKPIIIFTTKDGFNPHIGLLVDKVEDNVTVSKEDIKPLDQLTSIGFEIDPQTRNMMRGLIKVENKHSVIIDPSVIFAPHLKAESELEISDN